MAGILNPGAVKTAAATVGGLIAGVGTDDAEAGITDSALRLVRREVGDLAETASRSMDGERSLVRGKRQVSDRSVLSKKEKDAIRASVQASGGKLKDAEAEARRIKMQYPTRDVEVPWAPYEITGMEISPDRKGNMKYKPLMSKNAYAFHIDPKTGKEADRSSPHFQTMVDNLANEIIQTKAKADAGDPAARRVMENRGWYKNVEGRGFNEYGSFYDTFGDLLGATSPNTPVSTNFKFSKDILRRASRGDFDEAIDIFADKMQTVDGLEARLASMKAAAKADPTTSMKAAMASDEYKAIEGQIKAEKKSIEAIRQENGKLYGFNSVNAMTALADRWRIFREGAAPKAKNFSGNLVGYSTAPTIDVWSARNLRRHAGLPPIPSRAEQGVTGSIVDPVAFTNSQEFGFGQDVVTAATDKINQATGMDLDPRDTQALQWFVEKDEWARRGWTNSEGEGGSFETMMDNDPTESLIVGTSRAQSKQYQGRDFNPGPQDQLEVARRIVSEASSDPDVVASKAPTTLGLYGDSPETSFDIDIVSKRDQVPADTLDLIANQAVQDAQDSFFVARRIEPQVGLARPELFNVGVEAYFANPVSAGGSTVKDVEKYLTGKGVQGFTMIVDPRKRPGAMSDEIIGVRFLDIPQLYDASTFAKMSPQEYKGHVQMTLDNYDEIGKGLEQSFGEIRTASPSFFDVNVKSRRDAENYLAQSPGTPEERVAAQQEFWGFKPATERFAAYAGGDSEAGMAAGGAAAPAVFGSALAGLSSQAGASVDEEYERANDDRIRRTLRGGQYQQRTRQRQQRYATLRDDLLGAVSSVDRAIGSAFDALEIPTRGILALTSAAGQLAAGNSPQSALGRGAQVAQQPIDQTADQLGGGVTDAIAEAGYPGVAPYAGAAVNTAVQVGGF